MIVADQVVANPDRSNLGSCMKGVCAGGHRVAPWTVCQSTCRSPCISVICWSKLCGHRVKPKAYLLLPLCNKPQDFQQCKPWATQFSIHAWKPRYHTPHNQHHQDISQSAAFIWGKGKRKKGVLKAGRTLQGVDVVASSVKDLDEAAAVAALGCLL